MRALPGNVRDGVKQARVAERLQDVRRFAAKASELRGPVFLSLAAGVVTGLVGYTAGPAVSAVALGACGSAMTLTAILAAPPLRWSWPCSTGGQLRGASGVCEPSCAFPAPGFGRA